MEEDDFYLKWGKHHNAFVSVFDSLYRHNILVDCILTAEEKYIKAHRIVLMACSPYLQELLSQHTDNYPILFLDIKFVELQAIVNFCYHGEVKIPQNQLKGFIQAANTLRIKGLCAPAEEGGRGKKKFEWWSGLGESSMSSKRLKSHSQTPENESQVSESAQVPQGEKQLALNDAEDEGGEMAPIMCNSILDLSNGLEKRDTKSPDQGSDNSDFDSEDSSSEEGEGDFIWERKDGESYLLFPWTCNRCGEAFSTRTVYTEHRRGCTDTTNHPWKCHKCPRSYKNKKDLVRHLIYCGNDVARLECDRCGSTYKYERGLKRHQKYCGTDTKPLKCPKCGKTYKYHRGLRRHQARCGILFSMVEGSPPLQALVKAETFLSVDCTENMMPSLLSHPPQGNEVVADSTSPPPSLPSLTPNSISTNPFVCPCGKEYKYKRVFLKHCETCPWNQPILEDQGSIQRQQSN